MMLRVLPVVLYVLIIFLVSSIPRLQPPGPGFLLKDKFAHFFEYLILGMLLIRACGWRVGHSRLGTFALVAAIGVSIGAIDELYQSFIPGRSMSVADWYADSLGVAVGVGIFVLTKQKT